jgi:phosphotransferase family enzyme
VRTFEQALEAHSVPGTNLRGAVDGANWCFLLPRLELGKVLVIGYPAPSSLATLAKLGDEVVVWAKSAEHERIRMAIEGRSLENVGVLAAERERLPIRDGDVDVVLVASARLAGEVGVRSESRRVLKATGALYVEPSRLDLRRGLPFRRAFDGARRHELLWAAPAWGELRFAAPASDGGAVAYIERRFLKPFFRRTLLKRPGKVAARTPLANTLARRRALIVAGGDVSAQKGPPAYLRSMAAEAGISIGDLRWAFAAPGAYSSQKALFFLFEGEDTQPQSVVKITRDGRHNPRLENEWSALTLLRERGIGDARTRPSPLFLGRHAGLAILGETAVAGVPFLERTTATDDCPYARAVVEWLLELGISTAHTAPDPAQLVSSLEALLERFGELYRPDRETERLLDDELSALAASAKGLRLVFQHGDPGPWNVLVTADGSPGFLDWESADPDGMPLWDLFHFLRSFGLTVSRRAGRHDRGRSFVDRVLTTSGLNDLLVHATKRFCDETGLSTRLVEPLFYLCWVHRAVKEASRLPQDELGSGRYFNLLRLAVARRDAVGLQRLFSKTAGP